MFPHRIRTGRSIADSHVESTKNVPVSQTLNQILSEVIRLADKNRKMSKRKTIHRKDILSALKHICLQDEFLDGLLVPTIIDVQEDGQEDTADVELINEDDEQFCWPDRESLEQDEELYNLSRAEAWFDEIEELEQTTMRKLLTNVTHKIQQMEK